MKSDMVTKTLLALIALALWLNILGWRVEPASASAATVQQDAMMSEMLEHVQMIDENLEILALGSCMNTRLC